MGLWQSTVFLQEKDGYSKKNREMQGHRSPGDKVYNRICDAHVWLLIDSDLYVLSMGTDEALRDVGVSWLWMLVFLKDSIDKN